MTQFEVYLRRIETIQSEAMVTLIGRQQKLKLSNKQTELEWDPIRAEVEKVWVHETIDVYPKE